MLLVDLPVFGFTHNFGFWVRESLLFPNLFKGFAGLRALPGLIFRGWVWGFGFRV